jgi:hypothetical protein
LIYPNLSIYPFAHHTVHTRPSSHALSIDRKLKDLCTLCFSENLAIEATSLARAYLRYVLRSKLQLRGGLRTLLSLKLLFFDDNLLDSQWSLISRYLPGHGSMCIDSLLSLERMAGVAFKCPRTWTFVRGSLYRVVAEYPISRPRPSPLLPQFPPYA